ncbi:MAG: hypothetical protein U1E61_01570 [Bradyrhizobium sp.]
MSADLVSTVVSSLPILVFVAIAIWYARSAGLRARTPSGVTMLELYEQQVAETRRMNATLERIAEIMERRPGSPK